MTSSPLRPELPELPDRIKKLPVDRRGYPVPWFVAWPDGPNGEPEFRAMDATKLVRAIKERRCWVCGDHLGVHLTFVTGPMCAVNRISSEPPSHLECALFSVQACPFLSRPHMRRREGGLPDTTHTSGVMITRNPGVALLWTTKHYELIRPPDGGVLFEIGEPQSLACFAEGRRATLAEIRESVETGLPRLLEVATKDGPDAVKYLQQQIVVASQLLKIA